MSRHWRWHPGVRTGKQLSLGERAADQMRAGMGSWRFVFAFVAGMAVWAWFRGPGGHDPYPYILLNLFLSMLAGLQGAILLIAAKRSDQIAAEVSAHTFDNTVEHSALLREVLARLPVLKESL